MLIYTRPEAVSNNVVKYVCLGNKLCYQWMISNYSYSSMEKGNPINRHKTAICHTANFITDQDVPTIRVHSRCNCFGKSREYYWVSQWFFIQHKLNKLSLLAAFVHFIKLVWEVHCWSQWTTRQMDKHTYLWK